MSNGQEVPVGTGLDEPITNKLDASEVSEASISAPPSLGPEPGETQVSDAGSEVVEGHQPPAAAIAAAERFAAEAAAADPQEAPPLRDIGEASFGPRFVPESVIGPVDSRVRITTTDVYPWRVHCSLLITAADNSRWIGTAWFIGPRTLITAGHVVYIKGSGLPGRDGWVKSMEVVPGRDAANRPFGFATSGHFHTVNGWAATGDQEYDYGAITIPSPMGDQVGWIGYGVFSDDDLLASTANVSGYPGDKPAGTQWYDFRKIANVGARKVFYELDTAGGQSGSAVYRFANGARYAVGIHAYGGVTSNSGTRINRPVFDNIRYWGTIT